MKRRRGSCAGSGESSSALVQSLDMLPTDVISSIDGGAEADHVFAPHSGHYQSGSFATRCSLKLIHEVVSRLDDYKRELVESTGFGGLLHFPEIKQINRKFVLWLMSCVDESTRTLVVGENIRVKFSKLDVATVFGIPCCGKRIVEIGASSRSAKEKVLGEFLGGSFRQDRSIKNLVEVIDRKYEYPMVRSDQDSFRVAFVVFVVSTLLSPSAKFDYACVDYWTAISDADAVGSYDWAEFVIFRLLEAVTKLKQDVSSRAKSPNIAGCSLFLQVFYLDSTNLGDLRIPHNSFPRVRHFCYDRIRAMIGMDNNYSIYLNHHGDGTPTDLRDAGEVCYLWAVACQGEGEIHRTGSLLAIWESCVTMARLLEVPMEAAGPLFVAAAEFQDQVDSGVARSGIHAVKYISALVSIMLAFKDGFSYDFSIDDMRPKDAMERSCDVISSSVNRGLNLMSFPLRVKRNNGVLGGPCGSSSMSTETNSVCFSNEASSSGGSSRTLHHGLMGYSVESSIKAAMESLEVMPPELNVNQRLITVMSKFYNFVRRLKMPVDTDLNGSCGEQLAWPHLPVPYLCRRLPYAPSPWDLGYSWSQAEVDSADVFPKIQLAGEEEGFIIVHRIPKHIEVSIRSFCSQIMGKSELEMDMFDALIRILRQDDEETYQSFADRRWRHFFESDFMGYITSGSFDLSESKVLHHFSSSNLTYDLSSCKLIFFPALLQYRWSAMHCICRKLYDGWQHNWVSTDLRMVTWAERHSIGVNRVMCELFCRCFDGEDLKLSPRGVDTEAIAAKLCCDVLRLKGNIGRVPGYLT